MIIESRKIFLILLLLLAVISKITFAATACNVFVHGHMQDTSYFSKFPDHITWDSNLELEDAAFEVAKKLLTRFYYCSKDQPIIIRTHNYASPVIHYILGMGKRYRALFPNHEYIKVYLKTSAVYSYAGAFKGTPLMDKICSDPNETVLKKILGDKCILSLTTSSIHHSSSFVTSTGIPFYLVYGSNNKDFDGIPGKILDSHLVNWQESEQEIINQNDSVVPQYSSLGCKEATLLPFKASGCQKIDPENFFSFIRAELYSHTQMVADENLLKRESDER